MIKFIHEYLKIKRLIMIIPIRCFTCNKVIGDKWEKYQENIKNGIEEKLIFKKLGIKRYCCKNILLSHVDIIDKTLKYEQNNICDKIKFKKEKKKRIVRAI